MPKRTRFVADAVEPRERQLTVWCGALLGFGMFVLASGCSYLAEIIAGQRFRTAGAKV